jgi:hypothetical protein
MGWVAGGAPLTVSVPTVARKGTRIIAGLSLVRSAHKSANSQRGYGCEACKGNLPQFMLVNEK